MTEFPETRATLIANVKSPENRQAWEEFVVIYRPAIYRIARRRGLQDADAQDLTQNVLVRVAAAIDFPCCGRRRGAVLVNCVALLTIAGLFVEPRWVLPVKSARVAPYLSGRFGYLQQSNNFGSSSSGPGFGAGAGLGIKLGRYTNLDAGFALVRQRFGDFRYDDGEPGTFNPFTTYAAKIGVSRGFPR